VINIEHPDAPYIFAASRQLDLIVDYMRRITVSDGQHRRFLLEVVRPCFEALRWIATERFGGDPEAVAALGELEQQAEKLAALGSDKPERITGELPSDCIVCGRRFDHLGWYKPFGWFRRRPTDHYCDSCMVLVRPAFDRARTAFGCYAI
jgi:hypothetical protein